MYNYKDIWVWSVISEVVGETLNCEHEVKNPQDVYTVGLRKYGTTASHVSCICMLFFNKA